MLTHICINLENTHMQEIAKILVKIFRKQIIAGNWTIVSCFLRLHVYLLLELDFKTVYMSLGGISVRLLLRSLCLSFIVTISCLL